MNDEPSETRVLAERLMMPAGVRYLFKIEDETVLIVPENEEDEGIAEIFGMYKDTLDAYTYRPQESRDRRFYSGFREFLKASEPIFLEEYAFLKNLTDSQIDSILREIEEERAIVEAAERSRSRR